nr:hypothetical protein [Tanacetum cinerariifolium]
MTKVIKEEFEKLESLKINDDSFNYNTSLEIFHKEFNRISRMDDELFNYEVEIPGLTSIPCDLNKEVDSKQQMIHGSDVDMEFEQSNVEFTEWLASKLITIRQWINIRRMHYGFIVPEVMMKLNSVTNDPLILMMMMMMMMMMKLLKYLGPTLMYLTSRHLRAEGMISEDDESHNEGWKRWDGYADTVHDHEERENEEEHENEERCELFNNPHHDALVFKIRRFEMIKYSFGEDEEYIAIKEHEYNDLKSRNEDAFRTY